MGELRQRLGPNAARVAVVGALIVFFGVVVLVLSRSSGGSYEIRAVFDNVRGLIPGGEVTAGAVNIGKVTDVYLNEDDNPEVAMQINDEFSLHEGAFANIRLGSNVGAVNRTVALTTGDPTAPELEEGTVLAGADTDQPVDFDLAIETLDPRTRANIKKFLTGLDESLAGRGGDFDRTLRHSSGAVNETANLLAQVNLDGEALRTLVGEGEVVVSALAENPAALGEGTERTAELLRIAAGRQAELAESIRLLGPSLARGRIVFDELNAATPTLTDLVDGLGPVVDVLGPFARAVPRVAEAAAPFFDETAKLVQQGPRDLIELRPVIDEALPASRQLVTTLTTLNPLVEQLRVYTPEVVGFFQNFGATAGAYDALGHVVRVSLTNAQRPPPSTAAAGTIGPSTCGPGAIEKPFIRTPGVNECDPWTDYQSSYLFDGESN